MCRHTKNRIFFGMRSFYFSSEKNRKISDECIFIQFVHRVRNLVKVNIRVATSSRHQCLGSVVTFNIYFTLALFIVQTYSSYITYKSLGLGAFNMDVTYKLSGCSKLTVLRNRMVTIWT
jgi:hypothetical protein